MNVTVDEDTSILEAGLNAGLDLPHDCDMGVCMTCPGKLSCGEVSTRDKRYFRSKGSLVLATFAKHLLLIRVVFWMQFAS